MAHPPAGLFAELNKGADITKGLQHVDRHELKKQTETPPVSAPASATASKPTPPPKPATSAKPGTSVKPLAPSKPSVVKAEPKLTGDKWKLEGLLNVPEPVKISITEMKQSVSVFNCQKGSLAIEGKLNSVVLHDCKKFQTQVDSVIGGIELINSQGIHLFLMGKVATITVDKCEDVQIHLSEATLKELNGGKDLKLVTCKSGSINVVVIQENGDEKELSVPYQFVSHIENGKLVTQPSESVGV